MLFISDPPFVKAVIQIGGMPETLDVCIRSEDSLQQVLWVECLKPNIGDVFLTYFSEEQISNCVEIRTVICYAVIIKVVMQRNSLKRNILCF